MNVEFGPTYGFYGLGGTFRCPLMGNEGSSGSGAEIRPHIKENVYFCDISVFCPSREKLLLCLGELIFLGNISWGFLA